MKITRTEDGSYPAPATIANQIGQATTAAPLAYAASGSTTSLNETPAQGKRRKPASGSKQDIAAFVEAMPAQERHVLFLAWKESEDAGLVARSYCLGEYGSRIVQRIVATRVTPLLGARTSQPSARFTDQQEEMAA